MTNLHHATNKHNGNYYHFVNHKGQVLAYHNLISPSTQEQRKLEVLRFATNVHTMKNGTK